MHKKPTNCAVSDSDISDGDKAPKETPQQYSSDDEIQEYVTTVKSATRRPIPVAATDTGQVLTAASTAYNDINTIVL